MDFPLDGLDQSAPEQEIHFDTMATTEDNAEPAVNINPDQPALNDPPQEAMEEDVED